MLALSNSIADDKRSAFSNRLRHLQKLGFPKGTNTGRGKAANYDIGHIYLMAVALQLNQLGLTPERAIHVVEANLALIAAGAVHAARSGPPPDGFISPVFYYFDPSVLSDLMKPNARGDRAAGSLQVDTIENMFSALSKWSKMGLPRMAIFSASEIISTLSKCVKVISQRDDVYEVIQVWGRQTFAAHSKSEAADGDD